MSRYNHATRNMSGTQGHIVNESINKTRKNREKYEKEKLEKEKLEKENKVEIVDETNKETKE